jgi:hypothetical protein
MERKQLINIGVAVGLVLLAVALIVVSQKLGLPAEVAAGGVAILGIGLFLLRSPFGGGGAGGAAAALMLVFVGGVSLLQGACTPESRRQAANTALDGVQFACLLTNAFLDVPAVKTVCRLEGFADDFLRKLILDARVARAAGVPPCARDGGVCLPTETADAGAD